LAEEGLTILSEHDVVTVVDSTGQTLGPTYSEQSQTPKVRMGVNHEGRLFELGVMVSRNSLEDAKVSQSCYVTDDCSGTRYEYSYPRRVQRMSSLIEAAVLDPSGDIWVPGDTMETIQCQTRFVNNECAPVLSFPPSISPYEGAAIPLQQLTGVNLYDYFSPPFGLRRVNLDDTRWP
jgi:hypothetical protein